MIRSNLDMTVNAPVRQNNRWIIRGEQPGLAVVRRQVCLEPHDGMIVEPGREGGRKLLRFSHAASKNSRDQLFPMAKHSMTSVMLKLVDL